VLIRVIVDSSNALIPPGLATTVLCPSVAFAK